MQYKKPREQHWRMNIGSFCFCWNHFLAISLVDLCLLQWMICSNNLLSLQDVTEQTFKSARKKPLKLLRNTVEYQEQSFHLSSYLCQQQQKLLGSPKNGQKMDQFFDQRTWRKVSKCKWHHQVLYCTYSVLLSVLPATDVGKPNFSDHVIRSHS